MKPMEITETEYNNIYKALEKKASEYAAESGDIASHFLSSLQFPRCYHTGLFIPKSFRLFYKESSRVNVWHFSPIPCTSNQMKMNKGVEIICLYSKVITLNPYKLAYYLTTHKVGRCPWKEKYSSTDKKYIEKGGEDGTVRGR